MASAISCTEAIVMPPRRRSLSVGSKLAELQQQQAQQQQIQQQQAQQTQQQTQQQQTQQQLQQDSSYLQTMFNNNLSNADNEIAECGIAQQHNTDLNSQENDVTRQILASLAGNSMAVPELLFKNTNSHSSLFLGDLTIPKKQSSCIDLREHNNNINNSNNNSNSNSNSNSGISKNNNNNSNYGNNHNGIKEERGNLVRSQSHIVQNLNPIVLAEFDVSNRTNPFSSATTLNTAVAPVPTVVGDGEDEILPMHESKSKRSSKKNSSPGASKKNGSPGVKNDVDKRQFHTMTEK
eukprot:Pgem_evm2s20173